MWKPSEEAASLEAAGDQEALNYGERLSQQQQDKSAPLKFERWHGAGRADTLPLARIASAAAMQCDYWPTGATAATAPCVVCGGERVPIPDDLARLDVGVSAVQQLDCGVLTLAPQGDVLCWAPWVI